MLSMSEITEFLGWSFVINAILLGIATLALALGRSLIVPIHSKILGLDEPELNRLYASYLANYKIAVIVLCVAPYVALKVMGY